MTKGTKAFRIIICILLVLTMLCCAFFAASFVLHIDEDVMGAEYGIWVAGVNVTRDNRKDILGDGTVSYDPDYNLLTLENAKIEFDDSVIYSAVDLQIELIGENEFVMKGEYVPVIYASNYLLSKDVVIFGAGSLSVDFEGGSGDAMGIFAKNLRVESDITITMPDCSNVTNGIYCEGSLTLLAGANVTVNNGAGAYSTAVKAAHNLNIEAGSTLNVSARPGSTELCRGVHVDGSLFVWDNATLNVAVDDAVAKISECISVSGSLKMEANATVTASAKKACSIECYGSMKLNNGASISAATEGEGIDLLCYGAIVDYGATVNAETEALGGIHRK